MRTHMQTLDNTNTADNELTTPTTPTTPSLAYNYTTDNKVLASRTKHPDETAAFPKHPGIPWGGGGMRSSNSLIAPTIALIVPFSNNSYLVGSTRA